MYNLFHYIIELFPSDEQEQDGGSKISGFRKLSLEFRIPH